jgi:hypothetical protein
MGLAVATTAVEEDVDGGLLGGATSGSSSGHHCRRGFTKISQSGFMTLSPMSQMSKSFSNTSTSNLQEQSIVVFSFERALGCSSFSYRESTMDMAVYVMRAAGA